MSVGAMSTLEDELEQREREEREGREGGDPSTSAASNKKGRQAFDEDDQEALYMLAHDHQRVGRRGLGKSEKLKISGESRMASYLMTDRARVRFDESTLIHRWEVGRHKGNL